MKKLTVILSMLVIALLCSISVFAADTDDSGKWEFEAYGDGVVLTQYNGDQTDVYVPNRIEKGDTDYSVIKLGDELFKDNTALNSATLGEGITEIGASAFEGATELVCIVTPESLTTIGANAFSGCANFNSVILYDTVTLIADGAFSNCSNLKIYGMDNGNIEAYCVKNNIVFIAIAENLEPVFVTKNAVTYYIGNGKAEIISCSVDAENDLIIPAYIDGYPVVSIRESAFSDCQKITSIHLPSSIDLIEKNSFYGCCNLKSINLTDEITAIPESIFYNCTSLVGIVLHDNITTIGKNAFYNCSSLMEIIIPKNVKSISDYTFFGCASLNKVIFHDDIAAIGKYAFSGCIKLSEITIPQKLTDINEYAFNNCSSLVSVNFPNNSMLSIIEAHSFADCVNLNAIDFPQTLTSIDAYAFENCGFSSITIPSGVKRIGNYAFISCNNLCSVVLCEGVKEIGGFAFSVCRSLSKVSFPDSLEVIDNYAFTDSNLKSIVLPNNLTRIGNSAFINSKNLLSAQLPDSLTEIGSWAFRGCADSFTIYCNEGSVAQQYATTETIRYIIITDGENVMNWDFLDGTLFITGKGPMPDYTSGNRPAWNSYANQITNIEILDGITTVGNFAFYMLPNLKTVSISESVTNIGVQAFFRSSVERVNFSDGLIQISNYAFEYCKNLKEVTLPDSVVILGEYCFAGCTGLEKFISGKNVESIGMFAFDDCKNLSKITFYDKMVKFGINVFEKFSKIGTVGPLGGGYDYEYDWSEVIPARAFQGISVVSATLPDTLTEIGTYAFDGCSYLKSITIPKSVATIGENAFQNCSNITISCYYLTTAYKLAFNKYKYIVLDDIPTEGVCGQNATWRYENDMLYIEGSGAVDQYPGNCPEWKEHTKTLTHVEIGVGITQLPQYAFYALPQLKTITMPSTITTLGINSFYNCKALEAVTLPDGLKTIPSSTFYGCSKLSKVVVPASVTTISSSAFNYCTSLITAGPFGGDYCYEFGWTESVPEYAFNGCSGLESVALPDTVNEIGRSAFADCSSLKNIKLPLSLTKLGVGVFTNCKALSEITIPENVQSISTSAFYNCYSLISIIFDCKQATIGTTAFSKCSSLKNLYFKSNETLLKTVFLDTSIGNVPNIYVGGKLLKDYLQVPEQIEKIENNALYNHNEIKHLILPTGIKSIGNNAFNKCSEIKTVVIPESVTSIYKTSFPTTTVLCVYENSYAHTFASKNNMLYFVIQKTSSPEISYGSGISGTATYTDGTVASGATVEILYDDGTVKESVQTDASGNYAFTYAEVGRYTIRVTDAEGNTASEVVSVKRMNVFDVYIAGETDLVLKKGYSVSGTVSPSTAKVTISDTNGNVIATVNTTDGTFAFANVAKGTYVIKAENETGSVTAEIHVSGKDVTDIALEIKAQSATITGDTKIENRDGTHTAKIWVKVDLVDADGNVVAHTTTDAEGGYTFKNISAGSYKIVATANEMRPDATGKFDKSHELKGYAHIDITEAGDYTVGTIILREEKQNTATVSGKVTANGTTQDCQVILTNETGDQIAVFVTDNNGKYSFVNIPDGMYCITAITKVDGMGFSVITVEGGVVHGDTDIKVAKADHISKREATLLAVPDCTTKAEALIYKEVVMPEKRFYDSLSEKERKQLSGDWIEKLFKLIDLIFDVVVESPDEVKVDNAESLISHDEEETSVTFTLTVTETEASDAGEDGITTEEEYETEKIKDKKGKHKNIAKYYDIKFSRDGKHISNIQKQTETNGKLRITMEIPEEYRGHKHYSFIHMHKGEAVTLVDLDDNPNTVTFEIDKFSTFALAYSDTELVGEIEEKTYPASITYEATTGKISVSSEEAGTLYVATYDGDKVVKVDCYDVLVGTTPDVCEFSSDQKAFIWNESLKPICEKFYIN